MIGENKGCKPEEALKIEKHLVKADGNCLFNCLTQAMEGVKDKPQECRETVAVVMLSQPEVFTCEELGKPVDKYIEWLTSGSSAWGGIPELKALSQLFSVEIGVVVIADGEILLFGLKKGY